MIRCENLDLTIGDFSLNNINFDIPKGSVVGCIGRNGSGKTTLLKTLLGLYVPNRGSVQIDGRHIDAHTKQNIGVVFDQLHVPKDMKIKTLRNIYRSAYVDFNEAYFNKVLEEHRLALKSKVASLSKGTVMKLQIGLAMAHHPEILFMDEPTSGLDPVFRRRFINDLRDWMDNEVDRTIFFSTHITSDLEQFIDYLLLIDHGKVEFFLPIDKIEERFILAKGDEAAIKRLNPIGLESRHELTTALIDRRNVTIPHDVQVERATIEDLLYFITEVRA